MLRPGEPPEFGCAAGWRPLPGALGRYAENVSENKKPVSDDRPANGVRADDHRPVPSGESTGAVPSETPEDDEPAFAWMTPAAGPSAPRETGGPRAAAAPQAFPAQAAAAPQAVPGRSVAEEAAAGPVPRHGGASRPAKARPFPVGEDPEPMRAASKLPDLRSYQKAPGAASSDDRNAASAASAAQGSAAEGSAAHGSAAQDSASEDRRSAVFHEPLPTSMLQIRPPQEDVDRRAAQREQAAMVQPVLPRVMQVVLAVCYPVVLLVLAIRLITTPLFLWVEYHRPGFPVDSFGFSTDDRMTYGSYVVDYLLNFAGPRFLGDLVKPDGRNLFAAGEVSHMADVKSVITMAFIVGAVLAVVMIIAIVYLMRRSTGGVRRGIFAGSIVTLMLVIGLGVLAFMGWETFFTDFHQIFFKNGTWTFYLDDSLIRLFPEQFWTDSGLFIGVVVLLVSTLTLAFTWPTKQRRSLSKRSRNPQQGRRAAAGM